MHYGLWMHYGQSSVALEKAGVVAQAVHAFLSSLVCTAVLAPAAVVAAVVGTVAFAAVAAFGFFVRIATVLPHQAVR